MPSAQVFLTGATGLLGHHLCPALLDAGYEVLAYCRPGSDTSVLPVQEERLKIVHGDILDIFQLKEAMSACSLVVHAAAMVSFQSSDYEAMEEVNKTGTANVAELALELGLDFMVYISSVAALDRQKDSDRATTLDDRWPGRRTLTLYARSKFLAEYELWRAQAEGLPAAVVYPSVIVGSGDPARGGFPALMERVAGGQKRYPLGRSAFVAVDDVVATILYLLKQQTDGARILCHGHNRSWKELLSLLASILGVSAPTLAVAPWQSGLAWRAAALGARLSRRNPYLTRDRHRTAQARFAYAGDSFEEAIGRPFAPLDKAILKAAAQMDLNKEMEYK